MKNTRKYIKEPIGTKINELTLIREVDSTGRPYSHAPYALVKCSCGKEKIVSWQAVRINEVRSCGHLRGREKKYKGKVISKSGKLNVFYTRWVSVNNKFIPKETKAYKKLVDNNIKLEWEDYDHFYEDMHDSFEELAKEYGDTNVILKRKNQYGNFNKENCYWDLKTMAFPMKVNGKKFNNLEEISVTFDIPVTTLKGRLYSGKRGNELI